MRMEKDQSHMTERILALALEIVYLLTEEVYKDVKETSAEPARRKEYSPRSSPIAVPPRLCPTKDALSAKEFLKVTKRMMELLAGEVPIRCQDVTVHFSVEEWEYLEGHKELYKDVMKESQTALTSLDGSSNGNPPEGCPPPPLYSHQDPIEEDLTIPHLHLADHTIPHHHQSEKLGDYNNAIKEEFHDEYGEYGLQRKGSEEPSINRKPPEICPSLLDSTQKDLTIPQHHQSEKLGDYNNVIKEEFDNEYEEYGLVKKRSEEPSINRKSPERNPSLLDSTQKDLTISCHHQELKDMKPQVKEEEEEALGSGDQSSSKQEESSLQIDASGHYTQDRNTSEGRLVLSPGHNYNTRSSLEVTYNTHQLPSYIQTSMDRTEPEELSDKSHQMSSDRHLRSHIVVEVEDLPGPSYEVLGGPPAPTAPKRRKPIRTASINRRQRNITWTSAECQALVKLALPCWLQLCGPRSKETTPQWKKDKWNEIGAKVEKICGHKRDLHSCRKKFSDIKRAIARKKRLPPERKRQRQGFLHPYEKELLAGIGEEEILKLHEHQDKIQARRRRRRQVQDIVTSSSSSSSSQEEATTEEEEEEEEMPAAPRNSFQKRAYVPEEAKRTKHFRLNR